MHNSLYAPSIPKNDTAQTETDTIQKTTPASP